MDNLRALIQALFAAIFVSLSSQSRFRHEQKAPLSHLAVATRIRGEEAATSNEQQ